MRPRRGDRVIGRVTVGRPNRRSVTMLVQRPELLNIGRSRTFFAWWIQTLWSGRGCPRVCIDRIPDRGRIREPLEDEFLEKKVERIEEREYIGSTGFRGIADSPCLGESVGCVVFPIEEGERFVSIEVEDDAGQPVWASIYTSGYTDGTDPHEHVCGSSDVPLRLRDGLAELVVVLTQTTAGVTHFCEGPATTGTVTATFSNIR